MAEAADERADEEVGRLSHQVVRSCRWPLTSPAKMTASETTSESTILPTVLATWVEHEERGEVEEGRPENRHPGQHPGRDQETGSWRRREAVGVVEQQRHQDDGDDREECQVRHA